jgi:hypothetical protein
MIEEKSEDYYIKLLDEFRKSKEAVEMLSKRQDGMKKELIEAIREKGYIDEKGHYWLNLGESEIKYERRASVNLDHPAVKQWAIENGYWDKVKEVVEQVSEENLLALAWSNPELQEVVQNFYVTKETWAFKA